MMRMRELAVLGAMALLSSGAMGRDYMPSVGRYIEFDPVGMNGGLNGYVYANVSPLSSIDPMGLTAYDVSLALQCIQEKMPWLRIPEWDMSSSGNPRTKYSWGGYYSPATRRITFNEAKWGGELGPGELGGLSVTAAHEVMHGNQSLGALTWTKMKEWSGNESHNGEAHDNVFNRGITECVLKKKKSKVCN